MASPVNKLIGAKLKIHRSRLRLTQAAVAEALGCEDTTIGRYERGEYSPSGEQLIKLASLFGTTPADFLPAEVEVHWQTVADLRATLVDLIFRISDPAALERLITAAKSSEKV